MEIAIVGGAGHVGLPLSISLAAAGGDTTTVRIFDIDRRAVDLVNEGRMSFMEPGALDQLQKVIGRNLFATSDIATLSTADVIIVVLGTPIDEYLNPTFRVFDRFLQDAFPHLRNGQTMILRSTLYPGTSARIRRRLQEQGLHIHVGVCPERIAEGKAMEELCALPQIISGYDEEALAQARRIFDLLSVETIELAPLEAELAKLFTNNWRYIQFAAANQFYMLAQAAGVDFYRIHDAITHNYPRLQGFPGAGFTAGPCLFKDTMMLSFFSRNNYYLGHSAMLVNEGLPQFIVDRLTEKVPLSDKTVGILGMAFKGESDDIRSSLSFKLKKILELEASAVLCTDEYIDDPTFTTLEDLESQADILIIGAPHARYRNLRTEKLLLDVWNCNEQYAKVTGDTLLRQTNFKQPTEE